MTSEIIQHNPQFKKNNIGMCEVKAEGYLIRFLVRKNI